MQAVLEKQENQIITTVSAPVVFDSAPLEQQITTAVATVSRFESQAYVDTGVTLSSFVKHESCYYDVC